MLLVLCFVVSHYCPAKSRPWSRDRTKHSGHEESNRSEPRVIVCMCFICPVAQNAFKTGLPSRRRNAISRQQVCLNAQQDQTTSSPLRLPPPRPILSGYPRLASCTRSCGSSGLTRMPTTSAAARGATARALATASARSGAHAKSADIPRSCTTPTLTDTSSTPSREWARTRRAVARRKATGEADVCVVFLCSSCFFCFLHGVFVVAVHVNELRLRPNWSVVDRKRLVDTSIARVLLFFCKNA